MANISWLVPHFVKGNSTQLKYTLTCSTAEAGEPEVLIFETTNTTEQVQLQPYTTYQCCVSIMNEIEIWTPSCKLVASHEEGFKFVT